MTARHPRDPRQLAQHLNAAVRAHEGMNFIDNDEAQIMEQGRNRIRAVHQQALQRFRGNLQHSRRVLHKLGLVRLRHIAMPVPDRNVPFTQQIVQPRELVIDQRLQRRDIQDAYRGRRTFIQLRERRKKAASVLPDAVPEAISR